MYHGAQDGWVEVVSGVMFSGKSGELLRRVRRALIAKRQVQLFKSHLDDRYGGVFTVSSHDGHQAEAIPISSSVQIAEAVRVYEGFVWDTYWLKMQNGSTKTIEFDRVLLVGDVEDGPKVGQPIVEGAKVTAKVLGEVKGDKLIIQKRRRRKHYHLKKGHRQKYLRVKVDKIEV